MSNEEPTIEPSVQPTLEPTVNPSISPTNVHPALSIIDVPTPFPTNDGVAGEMKTTQFEFEIKIGGDSLTFGLADIIIASLAIFVCFCCVALTVYFKKNKDKKLFSKSIKMNQRSNSIEPGVNGDEGLEMKSLPNSTNGKQTNVAMVNDSDDDDEHLVDGFYGTQRTTKGDDLCDISSDDDEDDLIGAVGVITKGDDESEELTQQPTLDSNTTANEPMMGKNQLSISVAESVYDTDLITTQDTNTGNGNDENETQEPKIGKVVSVAESLYGSDVLPSSVTTNNFDEDTLGNKIDEESKHEDVYEDDVMKQPMIAKQQLSVSMAESLYEDDLYSVDDVTKNEDTKGTDKEKNKETKTDGHIGDV